jgi:hypothetical protein
VSQNDSRWIEIFRAGDYTAQSKGKITREDLDRVVRNYDPSFHEAPVCIGHPENDKPAFGWVSKLAVDGDVLLAQEKQVEPSFDEARKAGRFKKRSASFYLGQDGKISGLRHVAWLGAQPPEVKGLGDVAFKDEGRNFVEFDEEERMDVNEKTLSEAVASYFAKILGRAPETKNFSEADARALVDQAVASATEPLNRQITELKTELNAQTTKFSEREQQLAGGEVQQRIANTINGLKSSGKWIPAFDGRRRPSSSGRAIRRSRLPRSICSRPSLRVCRRSFRLAARSSRSPVARVRR